MRASIAGRSAGLVPAAVARPQQGLPPALRYPPTGGGGSYPSDEILRPRTSRLIINWPGEGKLSC